MATKPSSPRYSGINSDKVTYSKNGARGKIPFNIKIKSLLLRFSHTMLPNTIRKCYNALPRASVHFIIIGLIVLFLVHGWGRQFVKQDSTEFRVKLPFCNCHRETLLSREDRNKMKNSSCPMSVLRGYHQRVIAYSFYDDPHTSDTLNRNFFRGIKENLRGIQNHYNEELPNMNPISNGPFSMRLYFQLHSTSKNKEKLCEMACSEPLLDICEVPRSNKLFPMLWRYFPMADEEVDTVLSRDLDSRISSREIYAFSEFVSSDKLIHVMRDHKHHGIEILGGMFGVKMARERKLMKEILFKMLKDPLAFKPRTERSHDQSLLAKYLWPSVKKLGMSHDSYHCKKYPNSLPFPTQRPQAILNFVGAVADINNTITFTADNQCPFKCRPSHNKNWAFC